MTGRREKGRERGPWCPRVDQQRGPRKGPIRHGASDHADARSQSARLACYVGVRVARVYAFLVGSWLSSAAGVLTGERIVADLIRKVARNRGVDLEPVEPDPQAW